MAAGGIPFLDELLYGKPVDVKPSAFDPKRPNLRGYDTRALFKLVDARTKQTVMAVLLPHRARAINRIPEVRLALHATAGGYHVDRPRTSAHGIVHYVITGSSGVWPEGRQDGKPDGMSVIHGLKRLFDAFANEEIDGRPASDFELVFINPDEPVSEEDTVGDSAYVVVPERSLVELQRNAGAAQTWSYTIRLACIARSDEEFFRVAQDKEKERNLFEKILDFIGALDRYSFDVLFAKYQKLISPLLRVKAAVADVRRFTEGYARGIRTFVGYNVGLLGSLKDDLDGLLSLIKGDEASPDRLRSPEDRFGNDGPVLRRTQDIKLRVQRLEQAMRTSPAVLSPDLSVPGDRVGPRAGLDGQPSPLQSAVLRRRLSPHDQRTRRPQAARPGARLGSRVVTVAWGQTLDDLVPPGFTDLDVLQLNPDLEYPYVDGSQERREGDPLPQPGQFRVAYAGDQLRVPTESAHLASTARGAAPGASQALAPRESEDERIFGRDFFVNPDTHALELDPATGDIRTIGGTANLVQRLRHALLIPLGSLRHAPDFGSYLLAEAQGRWGTETQNRLNAIAVASTIRQDPGIAAIRRVRVSTGDGLTHVSFEADTVAGAPLGRLALAV